MTVSPLLLLLLYFALRTFLFSPRFCNLQVILKTLQKGDELSPKPLSKEEQKRCLTGDWMKFQSRSVHILYALDERPMIGSLETIQIRLRGYLGSMEIIFLNGEPIKWELPDALLFGSFRFDISTNWKIEWIMNIVRTLAAATKKQAAAAG